MNPSYVGEPYDIIYDQETIHKRIAELGAQITADYAGEDLVVVGVLKGAFVFMADLVRSLDMHVTCDFLRVSSYGNRKTSSGEVKLELDLSQPVDDKHILLVEDIVDTGLTLKYLRENMVTRHPKSVKICTLLHKEEMSRDAVLDYVGFKIPNLFIVGYGLDLAGRYRNLPFLAGLKNEE